MIIRSVGNGKINVIWSEITDFSVRSNLMDNNIIRKVERFRKIEDKTRFITGRLLLKYALKREKLKLWLSDLKYSKTQKPYFNSDFSFNISHSDKIVTLTYGFNQNLGCDIEHLNKNKININLDSVFCKEEQDCITHSKNKLKTFYNLWTRKEALLKAEGSGFLRNPACCSAIEDCVYLENVKYYLKSIDFAIDYSLAVASTAKIDTINIEQIDFKHLISAYSL